jgi:TonB family protein
MKKISILLPLFFICFLATAQKKQNTYFLKNNGKEVELKDSADFIRIIEEPDSGEKNFVVQEFYVNGKRKLIGKASIFKPIIIYEGNVACYNKDGIKKSSTNYVKDVPVGKAYYFFEDGKIQKEIEYLPINKSEETRLEPKIRLIYQVDSLGQVYVKDGNGHLIEYTTIEKDSLVEEGNYIDGFKDGVWKGGYASGKSSYVENYNLAELVSGVTTVGDKIYEYTVFEIPPQYNGGVEKFYKFLEKNVKYPREAFKNRISGKVLLSFIVEKDGSIADILVVKTVSPIIDAEAKRVLSSSPKWIPALQRGIPVRVKYNIPMNFSLSK